MLTWHQTEIMSINQRLNLMPVFILQTRFQCSLFFDYVFRGIKTTRKGKQKQIKKANSQGLTYSDLPHLQTIVNTVFEYKNSIHFPVGK